MPTSDDRSEVAELIAATRRSPDSLPPPIFVLFGMAKRNVVAILGCAAIGAMVGVALTLTTRPTYTALATVRVFSALLSRAETAQMADDLVPIIMSNSVLASELAAQSLDKQGVTVESFAKEGGVSAEYQRATDTVDVHVTAYDPNRAAVIANGVVSRACIVFEDLLKTQWESATKQLVEATSTLQANVDGARRKLIAARSRGQVEALRAETGKLVELRASLGELNASIAATEAELDRSRKERDARPATVDTTRTVDSNASMAEAVRSTTDAKSVLGLRMTENSPNSVQRDIDAHVAELSSTLAGLQGRRTTLTGTLGLSKPAMAQLNRLYQAEAELSQLGIDVDIAVSAYQAAAGRLTSLTLEQLAKRPRAQAIGPAVPPNVPNSRNGIAKVGVSMLVGLAFGFVIGGVREARRFGQI